MKNMLENKISQALSRVAAGAGLETGEIRGLFVVEEPRDPAHGHLATNAALVLAKKFKMKPAELAELIMGELDNSEGWIENMAKAGPGFINFSLSLAWWAKALADLLAAGDSFGQGAPKGLKVMVEFVSANPTGPLHVGHGRGAAIGDALARVLTRAGYEVTREYYINDAGRQMRILGESVFKRLKSLPDETGELPEGYYQGDYITSLAREYLARRPDVLSRPEEDILPELTVFAHQSILEGIKEDLAAFRVGHEVWFSETSLYQTGLVDQALNFLRDKGHLFEEEGALWFRATALGDEKDRVLIKSTGEKTYFAADLAYHWNKFQRGFDLVIDIWGADHHGYVPRMKAAVEALGRSRDDLGVVLVQMVSLIRDGKPVAMTTRGGQFITLREVVAEVGADAARFNFLTRSPDTTLEFDLELAKAKTRDNPVYYVQYVGARIESILKNAAPPAGPPDLGLLTQPEETSLIKHLASFPELIQAAAARREPHHLTTYLTSLARLFHHYYGIHRIAVEDNPALAESRRALAGAVRRVIRLGLDLLGVTSPDSM
ncbi:MAG: arginine--tRNA ligase [Candidatus Adiutrix sp.]|jgi:arginyl-tRNA synthetase|nr:arginine--tRNA ligase [Candidatus Adiutrix sp.]